MKGYKYIFKMPYNDNLNVFDNIFRHGWLEEIPSLDWRTCNCDSYDLWQPCVDWVISESFRSAMAAVPEDYFKEIGEVTNYAVPSPSKIESLMPLVISDEFHSEIWEFLEQSERNRFRKYYLFEPPVLTWKIREELSDIKSATIRVPVMYDGEIHLEEHEVDWSESWIMRHDVCYSDGGYFIKDEIFRRISQFIDTEIWRVIAWDEF